MFIFSFITRFRLCHYVLAATLCLLFLPPVGHAQEDSPTIREKKTKEGFLIDLKSLINRSKEKIEEANVKIEEQEQYKRNQQREEKAREYYEKGKKLYDEGKFDKATEFFERAVKITEHPEMKGYVRQSSAKTKKEQKALSEAEERRLKQLEAERGFKIKEVEKTYAKAVSLFKREKYLEARTEFQAVDKMFPDHKATRSYLMLIGQRIEDEQESLIAQQLEAESEASREEKAEWKNDLERKAKMRRETLERQAEKIYKEAVVLFEEGQFVTAKERFKEVEWVLPNYKSTVKYLKKLDKEIKEDKVLTQEDKQRLFEKQMREERAAGQEPDTEKFDALKAETEKKEAQKRLKEEADFVYRSAVSLYKKKNFEPAKDMFMKVEEIYPGYQKTRDYLSKIEKQIPEHQRSLVKVKEVTAETDTDIADEKIKKQVIERREEYKEEAERKYKEATDFYRRQNYVEAKIKFIQVEALYADYKDTRQYLARIDKDISGQVQRGDDKAIRGLEVAWEESAAEEPAAPAVKEKENVKRIYSDAVSLYKREQYQLAEDQFNRVNQISPGYKATDKYLSNISSKLAAASSITTTKATTKPAPAGRVSPRNFKADAKEKYQEAVKLYKKHHFVEARDKFIEVNELVPGYKRTKGYIAKLNRKLPSLYTDERETRPLAKEDLQKPMVEEIAEVPAKKEPVKKEEPVRKDVVKAEEEAEKDFVKSVTSEDLLDRDYKQAIAFYNDRNYTKARDLLNDVSRRSPGYKMTSVYLARIAKRIDEPLEEEAIEEKSPEPTEVVDDKERRDDKRLTEKMEGKSEKTFVKSFNKEQRQLAKEKELFNEQKSHIAKLTEDQHRQDAAMYERQIGGLYNEGIHLFKQKKYREAKMKFNAVNAMAPEYKSVESYLSKIDKITIIDEERAKIEGEIKDLRTATKQAENKVKEIKSRAEPVAKAKPVPKVQEVAAVTGKEEPKAAAKTAEPAPKIPEPVPAGDGMLAATMAEEWKAAEAEVYRLKEELKEKEAVLKWRLEEETKIAEIMALEEETERLELEKYWLHKEQLDARYDAEARALEESNKRIEERAEQLAAQHKENAETREEARREGEETIEEEKEALRKERDRIVAANKAKAEAKGQAELGEDAAESKPRAKADAKRETVAKEKKIPAASEKKSAAAKEVKSKTAPKRKVIETADEGAEEAKKAPVKKSVAKKVAEQEPSAEEVVAEEKRDVKVEVDEGELTEELQHLQASIRTEEEKLQKDRETAEAQMQKERDRVQQSANAQRQQIMKAAMAAPKKPQPISFEERYRLYSEEENEEALAALVRARQKELRFERERIREEFQISLDELYNKAVDLYHSGMYEESHRMFNEINTMAPSYKKTAGYLAKFEEAQQKAPKQVVDQYGRRVPKPEPRQPANRAQMIDNILDEAEATF